MLFLKLTQDTTVAARRTFVTPTPGSEFDKFLYAPIGETNDEMPLSVLSAFARQNVDPWAKAAELSLLPRESAIEKLAALIVLVTSGVSASGDPAAGAARLIALLPQAGFGLSRYQSLPSGAPRDLMPTIIYLIVGGLIIASALW
jgi:hypothetical protein